jgi:hypothetical protein
MNASKIERGRRLSALSRFTWNTATIGGLPAAVCLGAQHLAVKCLDETGNSSSPSVLTDAIRKIAP